MQLQRNALLTGLIYVSERAVRRYTPERLDYCVDLVEDCKKAISIHFFLSRKKVKAKQR